MGYALRHVSSLERAFQEYLRVLRPGGLLVLLEITRPGTRVARWLLRGYLQGVAPLLARVRTRNRYAGLLMRYYWDTIVQCVPPETILSVLREAGFADVRRRLTGGIFSEYTATKPGAS
jgi:demethylmenaquinone methyltransferase/2-methoxy-6-polyprenyl-1,4-benzoquinol methylase